MNRPTKDFLIPEFNKYIHVAIKEDGSGKSTLSVSSDLTPDEEKEFYFWDNFLYSLVNEVCSLVDINVLTPKYGFSKSSCFPASEICLYDKENNSISINERYFNRECMGIIALSVMYTIYLIEHPDKKKKALKFTSMYAEYIAGWLSDYSWNYKIMHCENETIE